jgi:hypothetical protein
VGRDKVTAATTLVADAGPIEVAYLRFANARINIVKVLLFFRWEEVVMDNIGTNQDKQFSRDSLADMSHPVRPAERRRRGYHMIESVEIQNFRSFRQVQLKGLPRINIVVGDNGAGKTALLEALFVAAAANPDVVTRFKHWRGVDAAGLTGTPQEIYDGIFLDLFHEFRKDHGPSVTLIGNANDSRSVRIYYDQGEPTLLPFGEGPHAPPPISGYTPVSFEWKDVAGQITKITPRLAPEAVCKSLRWYH